MMVVFGTRWKNISEDFALANPISKIVSELQASLVQTKACGLLLNHGVLLEVGHQQANLLNQAFFGCRIVTAIKDKDKQQYQYELSLEEAFYMCHSLKCLELVWEDKCLKSNDELWELMKSKRKLFPVLYKAYSHLRAKNWVVRSEIKYGADFVAYRHHPSLVHSEYAVLVSAGDGDINMRLTMWPSLHATVRLEDGVAKTLLVLHIETNDYGSTSSSCLEHYTVEEQIIARWNPEQCHEDHTFAMLNDEDSCDLIHDAQSSPHYNFNKFSMHQKLAVTSSSLQMVGLNTRWKGKGSKAMAQKHPMSELINLLQSSLVQSKACGLFAGFAIVLEVGIEQADLLNRACFGCPILSTNEDAQWFELSLEESFYLHHSLNCLELVSKNSCVKDSDGIWELMKSKKESFPLSYKAYSHLRAKNWVVRSGIRYGVDFVAYCHHPSLVHSEYAVVVVDKDDDSKARLRDWPDLHATVRLEGGVAKTLLVLHIKKNSYPDPAVSSSSLNQYTIEEQIVTRWNPERCRESKNSVEKGS
ncbi:tRNA-splicing endonuclease subunit Sen2 [Thalictrum thalictroides]|uniref:tRNA-intron lyase n=1 Tax=Thalictrum thalictroides TaxID=46969 RepID=A0A7J6VFT5_THATH|nr:tRNA-splicing endonuclease subunit Sen2 [Thalictrum thalictroides]